MADLGSKTAAADLNSVFSAFSVRSVADGHFSARSSGFSLAVKLKGLIPAPRPQPRL